MAQTAPFGRRRPSPPPKASEPSLLRSPLLRQLVGVLAGVGLAFAILAAGWASMRQVGRALDASWTAVGAPPASLAAAGAASSLARIVETCRDRAKGARLRRDLGDFLRPEAGLDEERLLQQAEFVTCLARHTPTRFCASPDRDHLRQAAEDYFALVRLAKEGHRADRFSIAEEVSPTPSHVRAALPSARTDAVMAGALADLVRNGHLPAGGLRSTWGLRSPGDLDSVLKGVKPVRNAC